MDQFDEKITRELLKKTRNEIGKFAWENKWSVIFQMRQKYGESLNKEMAENIYDEMRRKKK
jgi:hypothetical protein